MSKWMGNLFIAPLVAVARTTIIGGICSFKALVGKFVAFGCMNFEKI